jgi:hypothetical protein
MKGAQGLSRISRSGEQKDGEIKEKGVRSATKGTSQIQERNPALNNGSKHREGRPIPLKMIQLSPSSSQVLITQAHCEIRQAIHEHN